MLAWLVYSPGGNKDHFCSLLARCGTKQGVKLWGVRGELGVIYFIVALGFGFSDLAKELVSLSFGVAAYYASLQVPGASDKLCGQAVADWLGKKVALCKIATL